MSFLVIILIAVSLSMDAFSLSIAYGTLSLSKSHILKLAFIVGIYHYIMPLLGMITGNIIFNTFNFDSNIVVCIILMFIGIQMIFDSFKTNNPHEYMSFWQLILFGFAVSIDSFSVGIGLKEIGINPLINSLVFSISSLLFTYFGLLLGKKISSYIGKTSTLIGGVVLLIIGLMYII